VKALLYCIALSAAAIAGAPLAFADTSVIATVNNIPIPSSRAEVMLAEQVAQGAPKTEQLASSVREELIRREIIAQAARSAEIDKDPEVRTQMELAEQAVLIRAYIRDYTSRLPNISNEKQKNSINAHIAEMTKKAVVVRYAPTQ
jgi:peptidyl-prolyl cis-trans isomerase C